MNLNEIAKNLNIILDNKLEEEAILNILQAKLCHVLSFKNVRFKSSENLKTAFPISYYAFNFVPSGASKNRLLNEINNNLFYWFEDELEKFHKERQTQLENEQDEYIFKKSDNYNENEFKKLKIQYEKEVENLKKLPAEISASTQAAIYEYLAIMAKAKKGSILIKNTEFASFYEETIVSRDKDKKAFLNMLYNLYDGEYDASCAVSTNRENLKGLSVSCVLMSDYNLILQDNNLSKSFKSWLRQGMARRSFIYYKKGGNRPKITCTTVEEKRKAYQYLADAGVLLKDIYNNIRENYIYEFSSELNNAVQQYKLDIMYKVDKLFEHTDVLDEETEIINLNLQSSAWKIIKLTVLYHIFTNPTSILVQKESFDMAVNFFNKTNDFLFSLLDANSQSEYDLLYNYFTKNINKFVSKMNIRNKNFVHKNNFASWFNDETLTTLAEMAAKKKLGFVERVYGSKNQGREYALYEPDKYRFEAEFDGKFPKGRLVKIDNSDLEVSEI